MRRGRNRYIGSTTWENIHGAFDDILLVSDINTLFMRVLVLIEEAWTLIWKHKYKTNIFTIAMFILSVTLLSVKAGHARYRTTCEPQ